MYIFIWIVECNQWWSIFNRFQNTLHGQNVLIQIHNNDGNNKSDYRNYSKCIDGMSRFTYASPIFIRKIIRICDD